MKFMVSDNTSLHFSLLYPGDTCSELEDEVLLRGGGR